MRRMMMGGGVMKKGMKRVMIGGGEVMHSMGDSPTGTSIFFLINTPELHSTRLAKSVLLLLFLYNFCLHYYCFF